MSQLLGHSWATFDALVQLVVPMLAPTQVLDIGAGAGKYGQLIKPLLPSCRLTALEADPNARESLLANGYDEVQLGIAGDLYRTPAQAYDLVILGDVIEHMRHSEGRDLLEYLVYRSAYVLIVTPECMPMSDPDFYQSHNSIWRPDSLAWHDLWAHMRSGPMHFYLLRGYLNWQAPALSSVVQAVAESAVQVMHRSRGAEKARLALHNGIAIDAISDTEGVQYRPN